MVARERSQHDEQRDRESLALLARLVPQVPLFIDSDTIVVYVAADAEGRIFRGMPASFDLHVGDIEPNDSITVNTEALTHDEVMVSRSAVRIGPRRGVGVLDRRLARFPVTCSFTSTGNYVVHVAAKARRIHRHGDSLWSYRTFTLPASEMMAKLIEDVESARIDIPVRVEDTTRTTTRNIEPLALRVSTTLIESAVGMREFVQIAVNNVFASPRLRIVRGGGRVKLVEQDVSEAVWRWEGDVGPFPDSVVVEARVDRDAGALDIARASFLVMPRVPMLVVPQPDQVYAGEDLAFDIRVDGLRNQALYTWVLYEESDGNGMIEKASGISPRVFYHIPNNFVGKRLLLEARYDDRVYAFVDPVSHAGGPSRFVFTVALPPMRIEFDPPAVVRPGQRMQIRAAAWSSPTYRSDQPVKRITDIVVTVTTAGGRTLRTEIEMTQHGTFLFSIDNTVPVSPGGEDAVIRIQARESQVTRTIRLRRD